MCVCVFAHSPTFPSLHLRYNSFSNPSVALITSQLILQPFRRFTYVTAHSPTLPLLHLRHSSFSYPSFASPTSQALHLIHLASRPCRLHDTGPFKIIDLISNNYSKTSTKYTLHLDYRFPTLKIPVWLTFSLDPTEDKIAQ